VLPTLLALAGTTHPGTQYRGQPIEPVKGVSMLPLLTGQASEVHESDEVFGWELFGHRSVRQGDWKIVWDQAVPPAQRGWKLYNLADDPMEQTDLSTAMSDKLAEMIGNWDEYARNNGVIY
jgi:arylsulfatase A-like enzyme